ncbi:hypothetical protein GOP47_0019622 [Adiantum capillus-veneris]|uniref:Armadillo repeat-containing protein 8 n=1 Tax=Adiantum capillus-veneris TaxID=13818 RepID=A0A9D4Z8T1_ADICA|nr:hypothetical protein GOP47_0019622 [Adiantum capillus-veneris]
MPASTGWGKPEDLVENLSSLDTTARLKALRDVKNQIIGNKTKKLSYIKLGAVPRVVEILASDSETPLLVQSAAAVGSFACGNEAGVKAVLDSGVLPHLLKMLSFGDNKQVVEACARTLKMIFQSTLAPRNEMLVGQRMELLLALLSSSNENVAEVAAHVLARCCETPEHQQVIVDAGGMQRLVSLLSGSVKRREAALDGLAALVKNNPQISLRLVAMEQGRALASIVRFVKDKAPRTRFLACMCLANISRSCPCCYPQEWDIRASMLAVVVKLLEEPGQVGEESPTVLADIVANNEELQKAAYKFDAIVKLCALLQKGSLPTKQLEGVLMALAELCSRLEDSRRQLLDQEPGKNEGNFTGRGNQIIHLFFQQAQAAIISALSHPCEGVRVAACTCIKSISRSVKNLRTTLSDERLVFPLFKLLDDPYPVVQVAALSAVSNVVLDFTPHKSVFFQCGGVSQLIQLSRSMDPMLRLNAVWALRNLLYLADMSVKEKVMAELTVSTLTSLIHDSEEMVEEQALAFVRNLVYGSVDSVQQVFAEDSAILTAVERQLCIASRPEVCTQGVYVLSNIAAGNESHKEAVMSFVAPVSPGECSPSPILRFLQDMSNPQLRVAAVWCVMNLSYPDSSGAVTRVARLRETGIEQQLLKMVDDPCLDVKDRVKTALEQFTGEQFTGLANVLILPPENRVVIFANPAFTLISFYWPQIIDLFELVKVYPSGFD